MGGRWDNRSPFHRSPFFGHRGSIVITSSSTSSATFALLSGGGGRMSFLPGVPDGSLSPPTHDARCSSAHCAQGICSLDSMRVRRDVAELRSTASRRQRSADGRRARLMSLGQSASAPPSSAHNAASVPGASNLADQQRKARSCCRGRKPVALYLGSLAGLQKPEKRGCFGPRVPFRHSISSSAPTAGLSPHSLHARRKSGKARTRIGRKPSYRRT